MAAEEQILQELRELRAETQAAARPILTIDEAAQFMGVSKSHIYKLTFEKRIPYYKSEGGRYTYFKREELVQYLTAVRVPTAAELETQAETRAATKGGKV